MEHTKFKEGDWVKHQQGTQAMTVLRYNKRSSEEEGASLICSMNKEDGGKVEEEFKEAELVLLEK